MWARARPKSKSTVLFYTLLRQRGAGGGVVAGARLNFIALFGFDFQFAVASILHAIGGGIAKVVLAAQFGGDLVKGLTQFVELVSHVDDAASGGLGKLTHFALAGVPQPVSTVEAAIGTEQHVDDGIGLLGGFDGVLDFELAAFVLTVGEQDHSFAANFLRQHVMRGEIN